MKYAYWVENSQLFVADKTSGKIVWQGLPEGKQVWKVMELPETENCIVLLLPKTYRGGFGYGDIPNLLRCRSDGSIVWKAPLPSPGSQDTYTEIAWQDNKLWAYSWSCFAVTLDPVNGKIITKEFGK